MKEIVGTWKPHLVNHAWSMLVGRLHENKLFFHSLCFINWQLFIYLLTSITVFCYWQLISFIWWNMRYSSSRWLEKKSIHRFKRNCLWIGYFVFLPQSVKDVGSMRGWEKARYKKCRDFLEENYLRGYSCLVSNSLKASNPLTCRLFIFCSKVLVFPKGHFCLVPFCANVTVK